MRHYSKYCFLREMGYYVALTRLYFSFHQKWSKLASNIFMCLKCSIKGKTFLKVIQNRILFSLPFFSLFNSCTQRTVSVRSLRGLAAESQLSDLRVRGSNPLIVFLLLP
jgi:hypothetical protein